MTDPNDKVEAPVMSLDEIVEGLPYGAYHGELFLLVGAIAGSLAMENYVPYIVAYCAGDDWSLSDAEIASILSIAFIGQAIGSLIFGQIADKFGRRVGILFCTSTMAVFGILSAFAPSYEWLIAFRFFVGFGNAGIQVPLDLMAEISAAKYRLLLLVNSSYFRFIGCATTISLAWIFVPHYGWRVFVLVSAIPIALTAVASYFTVFESPRWLLLQGKKAETVKTIDKIFKRNSAVMPTCTLEDAVRSRGESNFLYAKLVETRAAMNITLRYCTMNFLSGIFFVTASNFAVTLGGDDDTDDKLCSFEYPLVYSAALGLLISSLIITVTVTKYGGDFNKIVIASLVTAVLYFLNGFVASIYATVFFIGFLVIVLAFTQVSVPIHVYIYALLHIH